MGRKYPVRKDGEWVRPKRTGYKMACCDCGLVHTIKFRIVKFGKGLHTIYMQAFRDQRATGQIRRHQNIKVKYK